MHRALAFGVGCHHAGLPTKYRRTVEQMLRAKELGIVIATTTLTQGIHAPCRTVLMAADSVFLNSTTFKQAIGRAGRRGFDVLGHVVVWRIARAKLRLLVTTAPATLHGNAVLSASVIMQLYLRLMAWRCSNDVVVDRAVKQYARAHNLRDESVALFKARQADEGIFYMKKMKKLQLLHVIVAFCAF